MVLGTFAVAAFVVRLGHAGDGEAPSARTRCSLWALLSAALRISSVPLFETAVLLGGVAFVLGLGMGCSQPVSLMLIYDRAPPGRSGEALGLRLTINNFMHIAVPHVVRLDGHRLRGGAGVLCQRGDTRGRRVHHSGGLVARCSPAKNAGGESSCRRCL